jgi:hypothetical protein
MYRASLTIPNQRMEGTGKVYPASVPASIKGWNAISSLADMPPDNAVQLDNWIPRPGYLEMRRGSKVFAEGIGSDSTPVETIMPYNSPNTGSTALFAIGMGTIYDITAGATAVSTTVTGWSNSRAQYVNFTNAADTTYLIVVNGVNTPVIYNGSTWADLAITGVTPTDIVSVNAWKGRLWFVLNNSTQAAYLAVGAIAGTASTFDIGPLMTMGGYLNAIATWTVDTKQTVDEYIAFISSRGQIFVYQGTDPTTANTFALVGVYNLGAPIGRRCFLRISGNLWILTMDGVIPMTEMLAIDRSSAPRVALTLMIMNAINAATQNYAANFGWQFISYPRGTLAILNIPTVENNTSMQFVMNTITGAWCRFLNLDAQCWELWNDLPYFGSTDGRVYQWDTGSGDYSGDEDLPITATVQTAFNYFDTRGFKKRFTALRPIITTDGTVVPGVGLNVDFGSGATISTPSVVNTGSAQWDVAIWDQAIWPPDSATIANWTTVDGIGQCASIITQVTTSDNGSEQGVLLQLNGWDLTMEKGFGFY